MLSPSVDELYRHRQWAGPVISLPLAAAVVVLTAVLFCSITVAVDPRRVEIRFGIGLISFRIDLDRVKAVRTVRNKWYYGWGIRSIPGGWLYNIAGLDAVELILGDDNVRRIGTDQPAELKRAIEQAMASRRDDV